MESLIILVLAIAAAVASMFGWKRQRDKTKEAQRRADATKEIRRMENEADTQDDTGLAERITRRGM